MSKQHLPQEWQPPPTVRCGHLDLAALGENQVHELLRLPHRKRSWPATSLGVLALPIRLGSVLGQDGRYSSHARVGAILFLYVFADPFSLPPGLAESADLPPSERAQSTI